MRSGTSASLVRVPKAHKRDLGLEQMALKARPAQGVADGTPNGTRKCQSIQTKASVCTISQLRTTL